MGIRSNTARSRQSRVRHIIKFIIGLDVFIALIIIAAVFSSPFVKGRGPLVVRDFLAANPPSPSDHPPFVKEEIHLLFTGDIMLDRLVRRQIEKNQDPLHPFLKIADYTRAADLTIGNLEGPVTDRGIKSGSIYSFRFEPAGTMNALQFAGFDIASLANNHIYDYGRTGLLDTITNLRAGGIEPVGIGTTITEANASVIKLVGDTRIAFFSFTNLYPRGLVATDAAPGISDFNVLSEIFADTNADISVVLLHWGEEYETHSRAWQQKLAHELIDAGADLIIGHHPHVAQEVEQYKDGWIAYSLGNFIFDQDFSEETMKGLIAEAIVKDKKIREFNTISIQLTPTYQPYLKQ